MEGNEMSISLTDLEEIGGKNRICWRVQELPAVTGYGEPYWRKMIRLEKIKVHRPAGTGLIIFHSDLIDFLKGKEEGN
jgi:hypothetical protein